VFKVLGLLVAVYTLYAAVNGAVYARSGPWGRTILREEEPRYFWTVIVIYLGLSVALVAVF
jgi:hypothetical protein